MKILAYLRFAWAGQIILDYWTSTSLSRSLGQEGRVWDIFRGLFVLTFVLYCLVMGIQELKKQQFVEGKYFYIFGTLYEVMIFLVGLYILSFAGRPDIEIWQMGIVTFWNIVLFTIILLDIRRVWTG